MKISQQSIVLCSNNLHIIYKQLYACKYQCVMLVTPGFDLKVSIGLIMWVLVYLNALVTFFKSWYWFFCENCKALNHINNIVILTANSAFIYLLRDAQLCRDLSCLDLPLYLITKPTNETIRCHCGENPRWT